MNPGLIGALFAAIFLERVVLDDSIRSKHQIIHLWRIHDGQALTAATPRRLRCLLCDTKTPCMSVF
jgi:hypothetical protein